MTREAADRADAVFVTHATWALERTPGMLSRVQPDLVLADSGLPCDTFNFVCRARLDETGARTAALEAVSHFAQVRRPFSWWVGPADRPGHLGEILREIGLLAAESELAMALSLVGAGPIAAGDDRTRPTSNGGKAGAAAWQVLA